MVNGRQVAEEEENGIRLPDRQRIMLPSHRQLLLVSERLKGIVLRNLRDPRDGLVDGQLERQLDSLDRVPVVAPCHVGFDGVVPCPVVDLGLWGVVEQEDGVAVGDAVEGGYALRRVFDRVGAQHNLVRDVGELGSELLDYVVDIGG